MNILQSSFAVTLFVNVATMSSAAYADCDTDYGDQLYSWAQSDARRQSLALADADFTSRVNHGRLNEYKALADVANQLTMSLNNIEVRRQDGEHRRAALSPIAAAVDLQREETKTLNELTTQAADIAAMKKRLETLEYPLDLPRFREMGGPHVGRSTILASFAGLAANGGDTLNARYSFFVRISLNENGSFEEGRIDVGGDENERAADSIAIALLESPNEYAQMVAYAYFSIRFLKYIGDTETCKQHLEKQAERARDAMTLLSSTLPSETELLERYNRISSDARLKFSTVQAEFTRDRDAIEARWRNSMAYTLGRLDVVGKTLTVEKAEQLRQAYSKGDPLGKIFNEAALVEMTRHIALLQQASLKDEIRLVGACRTIPGIMAAEALLDRRREAIAQLDVVSRQSSFLPLQSSISLVRQRLSNTVDLAERLTTTNEAVPCTSSTWRTQSGDRDLSSTSDFVVAKLTSASLWLGQQFRNLKISQEGYAHFQICAIYRDGNVYRCGRAPAGNSGLPGEFPSGTNSPYNTINQAPNDGGFKEDARKIELEIAGAKTNIDQRIAELERKNAEVAAITPAWLGSAVVGTSNRANSNKESLDVEVEERAERVEEDSAVLADAKERLANFARESADPEVLKGLMKDVEAAELAIPDLPVDAIMDDGPTLPGLTQRERAFPQHTDPADRRVLREQAKGHQLSEPKDQRLHTQFTDTALRFAASGSSAGTAVSDALISDAASLRYKERGLVSRPTISVVSADGTIVQQAYSEGALPRESILSRAERFEDERKILNQQQSLARTALSEGAIDGEQRLAALGLSERLTTEARGVFFSGLFAEGDTLLEIAKVTADLATAWTPGVSWGRDVYEAISGHHLISGEELDTFSRSVAIVGALTGSFGSKGIHGIEVASRVVSRVRPELTATIKEFRPLLERVVAKMRFIKSESTVIEGHALQEIAKLKDEAIEAGVVSVTHENIRKVIEIGQPYLDMKALDRFQYSGLVYVARAEQVGIQALHAEKTPLLLVAVKTENSAVDAVQTAYWVNGVNSVREFDLWIERNELRFRRLPRPDEF
ncbi:pre-toxin TG domain-containing protein [Agrobacterium cavarae]|uniref:pre-toxin TG domain-containing protein n=1 Tax=Agrobacterium cavarae TaxID=2528239 RepID=UPI003FD2410E